MAVNTDRYRVNRNKLIGQLVPFFLRGKKTLLYLVAITKPLDKVNADFCEWAKETLLDAAMTPQVITLKWALKQKVGKYFANKDDVFSFSSYGRSGYTTIYENTAEENNTSPGTKKQVTINNDETLPSTATNIEHMTVNDFGEIANESIDLTIYAPAFDNSLISEAEYKKLIKQILSPYIDESNYVLVVNKNN